MREMKLCAELDHPNIFKIHETFEDKYKLYFIIDEFHGRTLFDRIIQKGQLNEEDSAAIAGYLVSIIKYLHKNGVIVRNLRAESIVFEEKDGLDIKLIDLSLAIKEEDVKQGASDPLFEEF